MRKNYRVKSEKDFNAIFKSGQSFANRKFVVYMLEKVVRNRIKRKIRHVLMQHQKQLVQADFVVIARKVVEELDYHQVEQNLLHVLKIAKLYQEGFICETEK